MQIASITIDKQLYYNETFDGTVIVDAASQLPSSEFISARIFLRSREPYRLPARHFQIVFKSLLRYINVEDLAGTAPRSPLPDDERSMEGKVEVVILEKG